jgi:hypothetical protein
MYSGKQGKVTGLNFNSGLSSFIYFLVSKGAYLLRRPVKTGRLARPGDGNQNRLTSSLFPGDLTGLYRKFGRKLWNLSFNCKGRSKGREPDLDKN